MRANHLRGIFNSARGTLLCQRALASLWRVDVGEWGVCKGNEVLRQDAESALLIVNPRNFYLRCYTPRLETRNTPCRLQSRPARAGSIGRSPCLKPRRLHPLSF